MRDVLVSLTAVLGLGAGLAGLSAAPAAAGDATAHGRPVVLELFVSQNCAACMHANTALAEIAATRDVLPLTYDVDYWDYLGWRDTLAHPEFTARQREYADRFGQARVYTPQMVVDGREAGPGGDGVRIESEIKSCQKNAARTPELKARREGVQVAIEIGAGPAQGEAADIWLIGFEPGEIRTKVGAGENEGREFTVTNPVRQVSRIGAWTGEAAEIRADAPDTGGFAVLVQNPDGGPILAAASGH